MSEATLTSVSTNRQPMMGSRAIADITGKNHDHVKRDILTMLEQLKIYPPNLEDNDSKGFTVRYREYKGRNVVDEIWLNENLSLTLVTGYDAKRRLALIEQWQTMKNELERPRPESLPALAPLSAIQINSGVIQLARVVAEATMKACLDATGYTQQVASEHLPHTESEYVPVSKVTWKTGLSDATCRKLIGFAKVPVRSNSGVRGLLVSLSAMEQAVQKLIDESTPPKGNRKRWTHPKFGNFTYYADLI